MKQKDSKKKCCGEECFEQYYSNLFGDRWKPLKTALLESPCSVSWTAGGSSSYFLDAGSIAAALALPLAGARSILDMCAAPGGKTLVIASRMESDAYLVANERSPERRNRLIRVCETNLPSSVLERVSITCSDGAKLCLKKVEMYDRILLDAPCSSERHVLGDKKYLAEWTPNRIRTLAITQWSLLSSAYRLLSPGGYLLYSTCALTPDENDKVIDRLLKKFSEVEVVTPKHYMDCKPFSEAVLPEGEKTKYGVHILPDREKGAGPLYFCLVKKV